MRTPLVNLLQKLIRPEKPPGLDDSRTGQQSRRNFIGQLSEAPVQTGFHLERLATKGTGYALSFANGGQAVNAISGKLTTRSPGRVFVLPHSVAYDTIFNKI